MTEQQGEQIIGLLEKILGELKGQRNPVALHLHNGADPETAAPPSHKVRTTDRGRVIPTGGS